MHTGVLSGVIEEIEHTKNFFDINKKVLDETGVVVCNGFGRNLGYEDIYNHLTKPKKTYLLKGGEGEILAMASYSHEVFAEIPTLVVEGISVSQKMQGKGIFREITDLAIYEDEALIALRTQNPFMLKALKNYCPETYPDKVKKTPKLILEVRNAFAEYLNCKINEKGVVKEYYGGLFYGTEPVHKEMSEFLKNDLEMDLYKGDAVLVIGSVNIKYKPKEERADPY